MKTDPILLQSPKDHGSVLTRIEARPKNDLDESWLQRLIFDHPEVLPIYEFDNATQDIISVARELHTAAGRIDDIFIAPNGTIVIVETKLWKNPDKHRTVVAQIIDYAKELSKWTYNELDDAVKRAPIKGNAIDENAGLEDILRQYVEDSGIGFDEFQERVQQKLLRGEFILLIIGDRISPNVALLTDWIASAPGLNFRLGLVEMQFYPLEAGSEWPLLVVPDIIGRTVEKTRGVVKIQYEKEKPRAKVEYAEIDDPVVSRGKTTQDEFLSKLPEDLSPVYERWFERWLSKGFVVYWGVSGFSLRVLQGTKLQTVLDGYPDWAAAVIRQVDADKMGISKELYQEYLEAARTVPGASAVLASGKRYIRPQAITPEGLDMLLTETTKLAEKLSAKYE